MNFVKKTVHVDVVRRSIGAGDGCLIMLKGYAGVTGR
jgi:hypothetical protein